MTSEPSTPVNQSGLTVQNGRVNKEIIEIPKVVVENTEDSGGFASSVLKVLTMQRFSKSAGRQRDTWLDKYTYHRADDNWDWHRPLMRMSPSPSSQPTSPASEKPGPPSTTHDIEIETTELRRPRCIPLVLDPSGDFYFFWLLTVSLGIIYNYWAIILYIGFPSVHRNNIKACIAIDYAIDSIFLLDILVQFRTGFLEEGVMVVQCKRLVKHYVCSSGFAFDIASILPSDLLYLYLGIYPILRLNRLLKLHRFLLFCDRAEIYSGRPKLFNLAKLIHYLFLIIHWVACFYFILSRLEGFGIDKWVHPRLEEQFAKVNIQYLYSLYRSSVSMTTVGTGVTAGTIATPRTVATLVFVIVIYLCGVLIFATIVGNAGAMIMDMRHSREKYLRKLNGMKEYISAHQLPIHLKKRVIQWYDYLWTHKQDMNEEELFKKLNDNFKAEIAIHVNLATLKKVEMFHDCDPGFLRELVLKLKPVICSPEDFICRQGEKGREMYIVNKGCLDVLDEKETVLATLKAGSHFGEISLLNMYGIGNRRTASVRSVGFSDLFRLSKSDLEEVLQYYPEAKEHMEKIAMKTYKKQQRERLGEEAETEDDIEDEQDTFIRESDPRKWLAADTATLRRRLSRIESINNLRRFASRCKAQGPENSPNAREVLKQFAQKARGKRTDQESRRIVDEFVAGIRAREKESAKSEVESCEANCSSFGASAESLWSSQEMKSRLLRFKKKKRYSYSGSDEAEMTGINFDTDASALFRPRSLTMSGDFAPRNIPKHCTFQTLAVPSTLSFSKITSHGLNGDLQSKNSTPRTFTIESEVIESHSVKRTTFPLLLKPVFLSLPIISTRSKAAESIASRLHEEKLLLAMEKKRRWFQAVSKQTEDGKTRGKSTNSGNDYVESETNKSQNTRYPIVRIGQHQNEISRQRFIDEPRRSEADTDELRESEAMYNKDNPNGNEEMFGKKSNGVIEVHELEKTECRPETEIQLVVDEESVNEGSNGTLDEVNGNPGKTKRNNGTGRNKGIIRNNDQINESSSEQLVDCQPESKTVKKSFENGCDHGKRDKLTEENKEDSYESDRGSAGVAKISPKEDVQKYKERVENEATTLLDDLQCACSMESNTDITASQTQEGESTDSDSLQADRSNSGHSLKGAKDMDHDQVDPDNNVHKPTGDKNANQQDKNTDIETCC